MTLTGVQKLLLWFQNNSVDFLLFGVNRIKCALNVWSQTVHVHILP